MEEDGGVAKTGAAAGAVDVLAGVKVQEEGENVLVRLVNFVL